MAYIHEGVAGRSDSSIRGLSLAALRNRRTWYEMGIARLPREAAYDVCLRVTFGKGRNL